MNYDKYLKKIKRNLLPLILTGIILFNILIAIILMDSKLNYLFLFISFLLSIFVIWLLFKVIRKNEREEREKFVKTNFLNIIDKNILEPYLIRILMNGYDSFSFEDILKDRGLDIKVFNNVLNFFNNPNIEELLKKIKINTFYKENSFYRVSFSNTFGLSSIDTLLFYIVNNITIDMKKKLLQLDDKVFVITSEIEQDEIAELARDKTNRIIAPTLVQLTNLLMLKHTEDEFIKILAECLLLKDISPYQVNSGIKTESSFFGRVEIIRDIITKENANYLIVGARQLGKSSILKALERRYEESTKVNCYSFTMEDENIVLAMSRALGLGAEATLDEVVEVIGHAPKKSIFLIDEADRFVKHEKEVDYEVTEAFRKLSQEGKATFVLTGFWTLYFAVTSDYHSPLKNFGELIKLEGLDHNACRDLMIEPMKRIGVSYEHESIVENVIEFCGRRPNLIAITCNEVLKKLEGKVITQANIDEVVENSSLEDYLKGWGSMSENEEANRLDRVIIYLTLEKESFRLADIDAWLKEQGKKIDANRIKSSLERLVVGYILEERKKNYSYRVPLFREKLLEDDIEILLDGDLEGL